MSVFFSLALRLLVNAPPAPAVGKKSCIGRSLSSTVIVVDILVGFEIVHIHRDRRFERTLYAPPGLAVVVHYVRARENFC